MLSIEKLCVDDERSSMLGLGAVAGKQQSDQEHPGRKESPVKEQHELNKAGLVVSKKKLFKSPVKHKHSLQDSPLLSSSSPKVASHKKQSPNKRVHDHESPSPSKQQTSINKQQSRRPEAASGKHSSTSPNHQEPRTCSSERFSAMNKPLILENCQQPRAGPSQQKEEDTQGEVSLSQSGLSASFHTCPMCGLSLPRGRLVRHLQLCVDSQQASPSSSSASPARQPQHSSDDSTAKSTADLAKGENFLRVTMAARLAFW
jgi:hypothetical protein